MADISGCRMIRINLSFVYKDLWLIPMLQFSSVISIKSDVSSL